MKEKSSKKCVREKIFDDLPARKKGMGFVGFFLFRVDDGRRAKGEHNIANLGVENVH